MLIIYDGWNDITKKLEFYYDGIEDSEYSDNISNERGTFYELGEAIFSYSKFAKVIYTNLDLVPISLAGAAVSSFENFEIEKKADIWTSRWNRNL